MKLETHVKRRLKTWLAIGLLIVLQMSCTYTPVYDSSGRPQATSADNPEQTNPPQSENELPEEPHTVNAQPPVRVAVASPDAVKHKPTVSNKDIAAAKLRSQAANAVAEGQAAKAERLLNRALRISPRSPETYHQLATIKFEQGANGQALQLARKGLSLCDPDSTLAEQLQTLASQANSN